MHGCLFHVFRNMPLGREILMQSIYFCKTLDLSLSIYVPESKRFSINFENATIAVDLDNSYIASPETARFHAEEIIAKQRVQSEWIFPDSRFKSTAPSIRNVFDFMCCPRSLQDGASTIRLGHIGSKIRRILTMAPFPLLISSPVYKPWRSIAVFYEGSDRSADVLRLGLHLSDASGFPLDVFTPKGYGLDDNLKHALDRKGSTNETGSRTNTWHRYHNGQFTEDLYAVSHDALVLIKNTGNGMIRNYSSTMEKIQSTITNNLLIVGPNYRENQDNVI